MLRNELVEKWFLLAPDIDADTTAFAHRLSEVTQIIDSVIGKNYIPPYPVVILSLLQAVEASTPIDTKAGTYGYYYELLIRSSIARGRSRTDYDITVAYLAFLAYQMFDRHLAGVTEAEFRFIHSQYQEIYDIQRSVDQLLHELKDNQILSARDGLLRFRYPYLFYYFTARYMSDHIGEETIREHVRSMSRSVFLSEPANILMFLAHLSKNPIIVEELLLAAAQYLPDAPPFQFKEDVAFLTELQVTDMLELVEKDHREVRREMLTEKDNEEPAVRNLEAEMSLALGTDPESNPIARLNMGLKTLQILGQILKNFPGSLDRETKVAIGRACYGIGLRSLSFGIALVRENTIQLLQELAVLLKTFDPTVKEDQAKANAKAQNVVVGLSRLIIVGMIKQVSYAVGARDLDKTYERLLEADPSVGVKLFHSSLLLDHSGAFPERDIETFARDLKNNPVASWALRWLVVQHFYLFPPNFRTKQRICQLLEINYKPLQSVDSRRRLVKGH